MPDSSTISDPTSASTPFAGLRRARVLANRIEGGGAARLDVEVEGDWQHRAGQVAELAVVPGEVGFFAIASAPADGRRLTFLVRAGGSISKPLMSLAIGDELFVRGPHGRGYELDDGATRSPLLLVGVGSALSALRSALLDALDSESRPIALVLGVRTRAEVAFSDELGLWRARGVEVTLVESRPGELGAPAPDDVRSGHVQDHLVGIADRLPGALVLIAGSEQLEDEVTALLVASGVPNSRIQRNFRPDGRSGPKTSA